MKWIKYQVVNGTKDDGNPLFVIKRIEYNEANLKIAQSEAYAGAYNIEEDEKELPKEPLPIEYGGTNSATRENAMQNLSFIGMNPIIRASDDTVEKWAELGTGFAYYDTAEVNDFVLPRKGFVENKCYTNPVTGEILIHQTLCSVGLGPNYYRIGSTKDLTSWAENGWVEIIDKNSNKLPVVQTGYLDDVTVAANSISEVSVSFLNSFSKTPRVLLQLYSNSTSSNIGRITAALSKAPTKTGFKAKVFNADSTQRQPSIFWVAIAI